MQKIMIVAAAALALLATPAAAQVALIAQPGTPVYSGPPVTYDFETPAPVTGGLVTSTPLGSVRATPLGSTGNFWAVGPTDGSPGFLDLSSFAAINQVSFIWGSVDAYNSLDVLDRVGNLLASYTGLDVVPPATADGNQFSLGNNPLAALVFLGATQTNIGGLRFSSSQNAFEIDNVSVLSRDTQIGGVPEPSTWAMFLIGFGALGGLMRRKASNTPRLRVA